MKKNDYLAPEMVVVKMNTRSQLLAGSPAAGENPGFGGQPEGDGPEE